MQLRSVTVLVPVLKRTRVYATMDGSVPRVLHQIAMEFLLIQQAFAMALVHALSQTHAYATQNGKVNSAQYHNVSVFWPMQHLFAADLEHAPSLILAFAMIIILVQYAKHLRVLAC